MRDNAGPHGTLRSGAFRFALILALVFACGSALLLWTVARQIDGYASQATDEMLRNETTILAGEYRQLGLSGLTDAMQHRIEIRPESPFRYLLFDGRGRRVFGDLPSSSARLGWRTYSDFEPDGHTMTVKQFGVRLPDNLLLVVATDMFDIGVMRERLLRFTVLSGVLITLFALIGGFLAGRLFLSRLDRVNQAVDRIIDGNSGERLPRIGVGPEFDALTHNLNRMLERNAAAMEGLRQVSTAIAHDLRTPLMRLQRKLESIRDAPDDEQIDDAVGQIDGILTTFQALLRIGMLEGGAGRQRFQPVDLGHLMDRICQIYEPVAEDAGHKLVASHQINIVVDGDADLLAQLLTNLIENALVHTLPGTIVTSSLEKTATHAIIRISDTGPGVPPEDRQRIFRRFFRADVSRTTSGAGLGLSLVAAIVDLHYGTCHADDANPGLAVEASIPLREIGTDPELSLIRSD